MARRSFSVAEVESLIPTLEKIFTHVLQLRAALRLHEQQLDRLGIKLSRDVLEETTTPAREKAEVRNAKAMFRGYYQALADELAQVTELGGEVKDL